MRILFAGGGTGGHIYPIIAVAEQLMILSRNKGIDLDLRYLGAAGDFKETLLASGISISHIFSAKLRRYFDIRNFLDIFIFFISFFQALWKVFWIMPDVLFSKGGPGALAVVLAARFYRVPVIIHESDSVPGLTNLLSAGFSDKIGISFASAVQYFIRKAKNERKKAELAGKIALVGNPIRNSLISGGKKMDAAKEILGFDSREPLILIIGGSQGAEKINDFMLSAAEELIKEFQIFHQTGNKNFNGVKNELDVIFEYYPEEIKKRYKLAPYFEENLKDVYAAADVVVSRAGSGSIFEIAAFGKPAILIPAPENVVGRHQIVNAYEYAETGAAIVIEQDNLVLHIFLSQLKKLFSDREKLKTMSEAAKKFFKPEAAKIIAEEIIRLGIK